MITGNKQIKRLIDRIDARLRNPDLTDGEINFLNQLKAGLDALIIARSSAN